MRIQTRNLGCAGLAMAALLASDVTVMTAGSLPGSGTKRLSAQETEVRNRQDEERMFLEARRALNQEDFDRAAELFQALRTKYSGGRFVTDSYYWEAFGRYREGDLPEALVLLDLASVQTEGSRYVRRSGGSIGEGRLYRDVRDLRHRIQRQLAEQGDPGAAEEVLRRSEAVLATDTTQIREMQRQFAENLANMQARWEEEQARFTPDTAAYREMQRQFEARMRELRANWAEQQAMLERELQQSIERYRAQLDLTDVQGTLQQDQLMAQLAETQHVLMAQAMADSAATAYGPNVRVYRGPGGRPVIDVFSDQYWAGIDIHPECGDALIEQEALTSLLRLGVDAMPTVRDMLKRGDDCSAHLRYMALNWLADQGTDEARGLLIEIAGEHLDAQTRGWAVQGLENYDGPEITELLLRMLRESDDGEVQLAAIHGLHRHPSDAATEALIEFAANTDGSTPERMLRQQAAIVVAEHGAAASLPTVFNRFDSDAVRLEFLEMVGVRVHGGEREVTGWLLPVVADSEHSERVRAKALQAWLRQRPLDLEMYEEVYGSLETAALRDHLFYALFEWARSGTEHRDAAVDKMIDLARKEKDPDVRKRAVYWLGRTGSERAAEFLMEILRERSNGLPGEPN